MDNSVDRRVATFAALHHGTFAIWHLDSLAVTVDERRRRLESGRWIETFDGVYRIAGAPSTWRSDLLAAVWAGGDRAVASRRSAAALWQLPGGIEGRREITCKRWRRTREQGLVVHESKLLRADDTTIVDQVPVTTIERTLFDLCSLDDDQLVDLAMDSALRRKLTTLPRLEATAARVARRGRTGSTRFRSLLAQRLPQHGLTASERERLLFDMLQRHGFPLPVPQYEIRDEVGQFVARPDFAYPDLKIAIEYDSYQHHTGKVALIRDSARRNAVVALGWAPITATQADLQRGGAALASALRRTRDARLAESAS